LAKVSDVKLRDGPWHAGSRHTQPQGCVEEVDLDVNPDSPYQPKRLLDAVSKACRARKTKAKPISKNWRARRDSNS
jgi:hypothetical protein